jgi:hypothetical protein
MQFFITVPHDSATEPTMESMVEEDAAASEQFFAEVAAFNAELEASGALKFAGGLQPPSTAKTIDPASGEPIVLDEPFVVADSYVGGFWIIDVPDEAAAIEVTKRAATLLGGRLEVRAFQ